MVAKSTEPISHTKYFPNANTSKKKHAQVIKEGTNNYSVMSIVLPVTLCVHYTQCLHATHVVLYL